MPQRQGFSGLRVRARCAELHSSLRLGPGVCPGWCVEQAFPASSSCPVGLIPPWARSPGPCTGLHGQGDGDPTLPSGRLLECPPHWPHQLGSSEMTLTDSQPCLEFTDLGLTSMVAASACSKFCCQQKHVSAQVPTLDEGDAPEGVGSSWAAGASWTLPILPSLLSPGVWTHPAHRLLSHI